jgi:hypothetical protein
MLRRDAEYAGIHALKRPISIATTIASPKTTGGMRSTTMGPRISALRENTFSSPKAALQPSAPPINAIANDSAIKSRKITRDGKPIERITAISPRRSRMDIAAVFAATKPIATTTTRPMSSATFRKIAQSNLITTKQSTKPRWLSGKADIPTHRCETFSRR